MGFAQIQLEQKILKKTTNKEQIDLCSELASKCANRKEKGFYCFPIIACCAEHATPVCGVACSAQQAVIGK